MTTIELASKEIELLSRRRAAIERISAAEQAAGVALLDTPDETSASTDEIVRARSELATIDCAIRTVRGRRLDAVRAGRQAQAAELRQQAAELRKEAASIEAKVAKHITAINVLQETQVTVSAAVGQPVARSQRLQAEVLGLDSRAAGLEGGIPRDGVVDIDGVTTTDSLVGAVLQHPSDGPSTQAIIEWAQAVEERGVDAGSSTYQGHARRTFGVHSRRLHLVWKDSKIDLAESFIQVSALARRPAGPVTGAPGFELGSDIFKAPAPARGFGV